MPDAVAGGSQYYRWHLLDLFNALLLPNLNDANYLVSATCKVVVKLIVQQSAKHRVVHQP